MARGLDSSQCCKLPYCGITEQPLTEHEYSLKYITRLDFCENPPSAGWRLNEFAHFQKGLPPKQKRDTKEQ